MTYDENGEEMVASKVAAAKGISQVTTSRIIMAAPGMSQQLMFDYSINSTKQYRMYSTII